MPYVPTTVDPFLEPWRWRYEESLDGLSAVCMDEADDGTLWFGNIGSIARYDGVSVKTIPFDQKLLSQTTQDQAVPWAKALVVLPDGRPLVLVGETLVVWEKGSWRVILRDVGPSVFSAQFVQAEGGVIWFLAPKALWQISPDLQEISVVIQAEDGGRMESLSPDDDGKLWVLEKKANLTSRLVRIPLVNGRAIASADWAEFPVPFKNEDTEARIAVGLDGIIWYADSSVRSGLETFDPKTGVWTSAKGLTSPRYHSLIRLSNGSIIAGENGQIVVASRLGSEQIYMSEQLSLPKLTFSFFEASNQRLWMIGRIGYVYSIDLGDREWQTFAELNYQCEALDGSLWFLTKKAENAIRYDPKSGSCVQYEQAEGLLGKPYALFQTRDGLIWVAGRQGRCAAVSLFNGKSWTTTIFTNFANWIEPRAVLEAADGTVWLGAGGVQHEDFTGGLLQLTVDENQHLRVIKNHAPPQVPYYVTAITQTPDQTLWLGSTVVYRYDGISPAVPLPDLQGENTESMVLDRQNSLWVTKEHVGVGRWTNDAWDIFALEEGMASRRASGLLLLEDGSLLASSAQGMSRFDGVSWIPGVFPDWFAMNSRWSSMRQSKDGSLWFSYGWLEASPKWMISNDTTFYRTVRHRLETEPPETQITEHLRRVSQPGNVHVVWTGKDPWSRTPRKELYYSWRLDQGEWSPYSRETGQTFLSLEDGHHQLEVRARDRSFNVDPTPARIEFTVVPPVWKQLWFISLISFLVGLIALMVWIMILNRERYLKAQQTEREAFLVRQQADRERYLMERQQEHEAQLVKQQEEKEQHLQELDRVKTGFFTNISHELRTPMTVICGRLESLVQSGTDDKTKASLLLVLRNAQRVSTLITQLLDFRKIQEGKLRIEATHGDLVPLLRDWVASLQVLAEQSTISLSMESVQMCRGGFDFDKVQKIFTNLISNSVKYTRSGGAVRVILREEQDYQGSRFVRFVVEDNGIGISAEHLSHIFERFYRVSEASLAFGAGIGLNLTKELVELLGGEISVESPIHRDTERPGSRFTVRLPIEQIASDLALDAVEEAPVTPGPSLPLSETQPDDAATCNEETPRILVVEDDEDIRSFIVDGMSPRYVVLEADNGATGLQMAREQVPDLIITDLMMPIMDGVELCRTLKTSMETSHIPVVMLTAQASLEHQMEGLKTGADDYIIKPFHMELLQIRVANLLESRRLLREKFGQLVPSISAGIPENIYEKEFLEKVMAVVEQNYSDDTFDRDQLASGVNMSLRTLSRKLKAVSDRTPSGLIQEYRMMKAAELLAGTALSITDITFQVGCDDTSHFSRQFKQYSSMSPSAYRSKHQSDAF